MAIIFFAIFVFFFFIFFKLEYSSNTTTGPIWLNKVSSFVEFTQELNDPKFYINIGRHTVRYLLKLDNGSVLWSNWKEYRDFLYGHDKLHDYLKIYYPKAEAPVFRYLMETENCLQLDLTCRDKDIFNFTMGFLTEVGFSVYNQAVGVSFQQTFNDLNNVKFIMELHYNNFLSLPAIKSQAEYSFPLDPKQLGHIFPYSIVINSSMTVIELGVSLYVNHQYKKGHPLSDIVILNRPQVPANFENVIKYSGNRLDMLMTISRSTEANEIIGSECLDISCCATNCNNFVKVKGRLMFLSSWNMFMLVGTPILGSLSSLKSAAMNICHLSIHDFSRDIMLAEAQQMVELKMAFDQGQEKQKKLEFFLQKLNDEMKRTHEILNELVPGQLELTFPDDGYLRLQLLGNVSVLISDIVKFTTVCSLLKPMEVVTTLNTMYSKFDSLTAKHGVYKVETIGDAYMIVSSISGNGNIEQLCDAALEMKETIKDIKNPKSGSHLKIRIGIDTGPVVAGVVGLKVPKFCLFGTTIKTAALLEASSLPMKIKISKSTKEALPREYKVIESDVLFTNKKERLTTFWLISKEFRTPD